MRVSQPNLFRCIVEKWLPSIQQPASQPTAYNPCFELDAQRCSSSTKRDATGAFYPLSLAEFVRVRLACKRLPFFLLLQGLFVAGWPAAACMSTIHLAAGIYAKARL
jgi:hypothetical protein